MKVGKFLTAPALTFGFFLLALYVRDGSLVCLLFGSLDLALGFMTLVELLTPHEPKVIVRYERLDSSGPPTWLN